MHSSTMIGQRLTLLLCCATLCWAQDNWEWSCGNVTAQEGVNISQVLGRWYVVASNLINTNRNDICNVVEFTSVNESNMFLHLVESFTSGAKWTHNYSIDVVTPAKWLNGEHPIVVVDLPPEGNTFTFAVCRSLTEGRTTIKSADVLVFSKSKTSNLSPVLNRLRSTGVTVVDNIIAANMSMCTTNSLD